MTLLIIQQDILLSFWISRKHAIKINVNGVAVEEFGVLMGKLTGEGVGGE